MTAKLISAICTPLTDDDSLHVEGLAAHLEDQWKHGISGVLVGGTMGLMQLLDDQTYRDLVSQSVKLSKGRGEILVGVGDTSYKRTLERIRFVEKFDVDGIVILSPYFYQLGQAELIAYFQSLADQAKKPIFLYDLPGRTKTTIELDTVLQLSKHPNIRGIKCSGEWTGVRRLIDRVDPSFRVVPAQPLMVDHLARLGYGENLDGVYSIVPGLSTSIVEAVAKGDEKLAAVQQGKLTELLMVLVSAYPLFPACSAVLNARGIPGKVHHLPTKSLTKEQTERLLSDPRVSPLLK
jgi:4-hydroxy-tetrahydrodipicolinate synthase